MTGGKLMAHLGRAEAKLCHQHQQMISEVGNLEYQLFPVFLHPRYYHFGGFLARP